VRLFEPGQVVGAFRLEEVLYQGGTATLWRVTGGNDAAFPLLMKIPFVRPGENPIAIVGFEVERMVLPQLATIHAPRFVASGDFEMPYIVMERIEGQLLDSRRGEMPLPFDEVAAIGAKIAVALHELHRQHVIHLDVKPENIMLRQSGEAALIDFGFARHDQLPDLLAEEFPGPIGTGPYIAPEQIDGERGDPRSDVFALGAVLYLLATGEFPFGEPLTARGWRRRLYWDPVPPRRWRADIPPWLQEVILRCLEIDPAARYRTAAQVAFDLTHPDPIALTARATRKKRAGGLIMAFRRWLERLRLKPEQRQSTLAGRLSEAPIIVAAVDLGAGMEPLAEALRTEVRRILLAEPGARLACVNVLKVARIGLDQFADAEGRNLHLQRLVELKHWARPLGSATDQITYHVFERTDPAAALIDFVRANQADHIVIGARGSSTMRRYLGSVSSQVVAEAPCTVTVVRVR
jgi:nucleotide-binding universal stress UspA family protein